MATFPEDMSVAIDELGSAIAEVESRLESARAERDEAKARQIELELENAGLRRELALARDQNERLFSETREALEWQTATAEILKVIASTPSDVQPVFEAIASSAKRLLGGFSTTVLHFIGDELHLVAYTPTSPEADEALKSSFPRKLAEFPTFALVRNGETVQFADTEAEEVPEANRELARLRGFRSVLFTPLMNRGTSVGMISVTRAEPGAFAPHHVQLLQTFADQAVIAIENARLFKETQEALERQTATAEILKVIASSPSDTAPVFEAIANSTKRLLGGFAVAVFRLVDGKVHLAAFTPTNPAADEALRSDFPTPVEDFEAFRLAQHGKPFPIPDTEEVSNARVREIARLHGFRSMLWVPMVSGGVTIGVISVTRAEPGAFAAHHVQLLQTFADQAVIAIENTRLFNETKEALERQTATADILKVIASSPSDVQPVFDAIAHSANRLIGGFSAAVFRYLDRRIHLAAFTPTDAEGDAVLQSSFPVPLEEFPPYRLTREGAPAQLPDTDLEPAARDIARARGYRSMLFAPLMNDGEPVGIITVTRVAPGPFGEQHVRLLQMFADQAIIAIKNIGLFNEVQARTNDLSESLRQQTAVGDVLKTISRSTFDLQPVLDTLVNSAAQLCDADMAFIMRRVGDEYRAGAAVGYTEAYIDFLTNHPLPVDRGTVTGRAVLESRPVQIADVVADPEYTLHETTTLAGQRTTLGVPLLRENEPIGVIVLARKRVEPFTQKQIDLVATFADQAVIAIENVRLFNEVQQRTSDLSEALTYQTGSANILRVIASSPTDVGPVLDAIVESACELCDANDAIVYLKENEHLSYKAHHGPIPVIFGEKRAINRDYVAGRSVVDKMPIHVSDVFSEDGAEFPEARELSRSEGIRSILSAPLLRENESIGAILLRRTEVHPFTGKQIGLLQTFADQAVIAIGNVRLFEEVQQRTRELSESLEQQTATSEVLGVISRSAGDLEPVFQSMLENATRICGAQFGLMNLRENDNFRTVAFHNVPPEFLSARKDSFRVRPDGILGQIVRTRQVAHTPDLSASALYAEGDPPTRHLVDLAGARTILVVPMLKDSELVGTIGIYRREVMPFNEKQIALLTGFANQAVIAIENTRLLKELRQRTDDLSQSLHELRTAQDRLVQTEKLASLGQLTAGIAHEIKNPLNFVNNFAALSAELIEELNDVLRPAEIAEKVRAEVDELTGLLRDNLDRVVQHGKRADSIVKNMLLHSREGGGEHRLSDINALVDESLNLAYHGARAEKPGFNVTLERDFDPAAGQIDVLPQEITRVFLNLVSNGFYAVTKRRKEGGEPGFEPTLRASTRNLGDAVEIRIRDNGTGIPPEAKERMFNPFFTTKPAGEGTGLGLSMSHDIIVKQHGGTIDVDTEQGHFTEFRIVLPRTSNFAES